MSHEQNLSKFHIWLLAARLKTLPAGIVPVLVAGVIAWHDSVFHLGAFLAALFGSVMIQIGTNFANDLFDYKKQTDTSERIGPLRVTQAGLVTSKQMAAATSITFGLAFAAGIYLVYRGGWPLVIIGVASIACGVLYTAGPLALGYIGLGDLFVLAFFGPVALGGTYYAQAVTIRPEIIWAGLPFGMISTAILVVNNMRDIDTDKKSRKLTLAVRWGRKFARIEYIVMLSGAALFALMLFLLDYASIWMLLCFIYLLIALPTVKVVFTSTDGGKLNDALAATGRLLVIYGLLFSLGWIL